MFSSKSQPRVLRQCYRCWQLTQPGQLRTFKVTVVGAAGGVGQPLCMLLRLNKLITELVMHDLKECKGVATDISHICTQQDVKSYAGAANLGKAIKCADIVILPAGLPRKPGMQRDQLFDANATVVAKVTQAVAANAPSALFAIITNPVNSLVPMAAEILKQEQAYDPNRLFGVTTLDVVRTEKFVSDYLNVQPQKVKIPVIGGHSGITILPVFSQCKPVFTGEPDCIAAMKKRIQNAGNEVVKAKAGKGSATLSMAFAAARLMNAMLLGLKGEKGPPECVFVESKVTECPFFATPIEFGPKGIAQNLGLPELDDTEKEDLKKLIPELKIAIDAGVKYAKSL
ncbi:malate dehydrogenase, mitochondrial-like [Scaptodrosophila lebanonensis]|uniref:Malate dehydrogenase n=1 Tax=Drosophila lebanonensis TaxID=7225 RepID=A0A6J2U101_DROLE|nr:malate dehydrogenase, mitochondrial-like [Scaptodrosophila lebanonensis]